MRIAAGRRPKLQQHVIICWADVHPHMPEELLLQRPVLLQAALHSQAGEIGNPTLILALIRFHYTTCSLHAASDALHRLLSAHRAEARYNHKSNFRML